ncbi:MAG: (d)CMP kinase [Myxococcota bacterium]|nr:(d)CMP kinase [Myxococcota bacterium]
MSASESAPRGFAIAIDGPASSGKGTVARLVAQRLGFAYVDTGSMYRSVALTALREKVPWEDEFVLADIAEGLRFQFRFDDGAFRVAVNGEDFTHDIRTEQVGKGASKVATLPLVRKALLGVQRELAATQGVVLDGRDIGTVVLPDAPLKVFLDADLDVRANRRHAELAGRGVEKALSQVRADLAARDAQDAGRETAPLAQAEDAIYLDTTRMTPEAAADHIIGLARERGV